MLFPVRCTSCGKPIGQLWEKFDQQTKGRTQNVKETLDELGVKRYCCRQQFMGYVDVTSTAAQLKRT